MSLLDAARRLVRDLKSLRFGPPVTHVYNPLDYAWKSHAAYLTRYGKGRKEVVLLGMNPGPWGMAQTGVPFGAVEMVRDWLGIEEAVGTPPNEHPRRRVEGFGCARNEVSGMRLWGWARDRFGTPDRFFERFFVANYCPLLFLRAQDDGRVQNFTPDKLKKDESERLHAACDRHLVRVLEILQPRFAIGVGQFAQSRLRAVLEREEEGDDGTGRTRISADGVEKGMVVGRILHPSGANPEANRDWAGKIERQLREYGIRPVG